MGIGPAWSRRAGPGRFGAYLMGGKGVVRASSSLGWASMAGNDPGSTGTTLFMLGVRWSPANGPLELGGEYVRSVGQVALWDDPPVVEDAGGVHLLRSEEARLSGLMLRLGYCFGRGGAE